MRSGRPGTPTAGRESRVRPPACPALCLARSPQHLGGWPAHPGGDFPVLRPQGSTTPPARAGEAREPPSEPPLTRARRRAHKPLLWRGLLTARLRAAGPLLLASLPSLPPLRSSPLAPQGLPHPLLPPPRPLPMRLHPSSLLSLTRARPGVAGDWQGPRRAAGRDRNHCQSPLGSLPEEVPRKVAPGTVQYTGPGVGDRDTPGRPSEWPRPERVCRGSAGPVLARGAESLRD